MDETFKSYLSSVLRNRYEEDSVDRLNYMVTTYIFIAAAITIITKVPSSNVLIAL